MVKLHIKKGDVSQFIFETTVAVPMSELLVQVGAVISNEGGFRGRSSPPNLNIVSTAHKDVQRPPPDRSSG
jgi:hypothetical protein